MLLLLFSFSSFLFSCAVLFVHACLTVHAFHVLSLCGANSVCVCMCVCVCVCVCAYVRIIMRCVVGNQRRTGEPEREPECYVASSETVGCENLSRLTEE